MAPVKQPTTLTAICTACQWTGQRSLEKGEDLVQAYCPRCQKKQLADIATQEG